MVVAPADQETVVAPEIVVGPADPDIVVALDTVADRDTAAADWGRPRKGEAVPARCPQRGRSVSAGPCSIPD
jgi:hypothetical protein